MQQWYGAVNLYCLQRHLCESEEEEEEEEEEACSEISSGDGIRWRIVRDVEA